ncbi:MAG TPA: S8 family serine peptidase [Solirubrobacteraceae bacterium]
MRARWLSVLVVMAAVLAVAAPCDASLFPRKARFDRPPPVGAQASIASRRPSARALRGRVAVTFAPGFGPAAQARAIGLVHGAVLRRVGQLRLVEIRVAAGRERRAIRTLTRVRAVESVERVFPLREAHANCVGNPACSIPNDPLFNQQWYLQNDAGTVQPSGAAAPVFGADIDAPLGWAAGVPSAPVIVGVLDTGVDATHPDLVGRVTDQVTVPSTSDHYSDDNWHGTFVAGIIAANSGNGQGVAGIAPNARIYSISPADALGRHNLFDPVALAGGVIWAADHGVNVLNISLVGSAFSVVMHNALVYAYNDGVLVVASAGNGGDATPTYPAADTDVLSVGALSPDDQRAPFSSYGQSWVDMAAPGVGIVSAVPGGQYAIGDGTSATAPIVSGVAAAVWPTVTDANADGSKADDVAQRLLQTADRLPGTGTQWSGGRPDLCRALMPAAGCNAPTPATPATPAAPVQSPEPASPVRVRVTAGRYDAVASGPLALEFTVGRAGTALTRLAVSLRLTCPHGRISSQSITALSSTDSQAIRADGSFTLLVGLAGDHLRRGLLTIRGAVTSLGTARGVLSATARWTGARTGRCELAQRAWRARLR